MLFLQPFDHPAVLGHGLFNIQYAGNGDEIGVRISHCPVRRYNHIIESAYGQTVRRNNLDLESRVRLHMIDHLPLDPDLGKNIMGPGNGGDRYIVQGQNGDTNFFCFRFAHGDINMFIVVFDTFFMGRQGI